jgi:2-oxoglutarate ferredoxin oxidoreductase subunit beta
MKDNTMFVSPVGCSVFAYDYINVDFQEAAHGRACALATGIKRMLPEKYVFTYQGDGDLASIGLAETIHACNRGENIIIFFVNNAIYGMTGGQMAPTSLPGQKTTTSPYGRDTDTVGFPLRMSEIIAGLPAAAYVERMTMNDPGHIRKAKKTIKKAFEMQKENVGTIFLEFVSNCPSGWKLSPVQAIDFTKNDMMDYYKLGVYKNYEEK